MLQLMAKKLLKKLVCLKTNESGLSQLLNRSFISIYLFVLHHPLAGYIFTNLDQAVHYWAAYLVSKADECWLLRVAGHGLTKVWKRGG